MFIHINSVNLKNNYKSRKKKKTKEEEDLGFIRFTVVYFSMAKKKRASSKKRSDVIYVERITRGKNPFQEPDRPTAWTAEINERIVDY